MNRMFDTHPPIEDRIAKLDAMAGQFQEIVPGPAAPEARTPQ